MRRFLMWSVFIALQVPITVIGVVAYVVCGLIGTTLDLADRFSVWLASGLSREISEAKYELKMALNHRDESIASLLPGGVDGR
jgi:hypothetical protein